jgi:hypothetical protein
LDEEQRKPRIILLLDESVERIHAEAADDAKHRGTRMSDRSGIQKPWLEALIGKSVVEGICRLATPSL